MVTLIWALALYGAWMVGRQAATLTIKTIRFIKEWDRAARSLCTMKPQPVALSLIKGDTA